MPYPKEKMASYNKSYYEENKETIAVKQSAKEVCKYCDRSVRHDNILKHTKSSYCKNRRKLNATMIAEKKKAFNKEIDDMHSEFIHLCELTKIIEFATPPFVDFLKLSTKPKTVKFTEVPDLTEVEEEYMNKYHEICGRLNRDEIDYEDLTEWEQDLLTNRGVYLHMC